MLQGVFVAGRDFFAKFYYGVNKVTPLLFYSISEEGSKSDSILVTLDGSSFGKLCPVLIQLLYNYVCGGGVE